MALPPLTPEQRAAALEKAAVARRERAAVKNRLKYSRAPSPRSSRTARPTTVIGKMKVSALLESMPGVGRVRARQIMEEVGISETPPGARPRRQPDRGAAARFDRRDAATPRPPSRETQPPGPARRPRRPDRRRQGHRRRLRPHALPGGLALGLDDHAPAAARRGRRRALPLRRRRTSSTGSSRRASSSSGPSCTAAPVRHPARPGRARPGEGRDGAARDRPAGRPPGARARCPRRSSSSSRRRAGTSWCAGWSAAAPRTRRSGSAGWPPRRAELAAQREFDVTIVNDDVRRASEELVSLMRSRTLSSAGAARRAAPVTTRHEPTKRDSPCPVPRLPPRHHQPADRRPADRGRLQVRPGHLLRQARPPDQRLLLPAAGGPARVRRPARRDRGPREAAVDRAARDQRGPADLRRRPRPEPPPSRTQPMRVVLGVSGGHRRLQGVLAAAAASPRPGTTSPSCRPRRRCSSSARRPGRRCPASRCAPTCGPRPRGAARAPRPDGRPRRRRPGHRRPARQGRRTAWPTTCSPPRCSPPAARWSSPRRCTPRCGSTRPPGPTSRRCARAASHVIEPASAGSPARTPARAACPSPRSCMPRASRSSQAPRPRRPRPPLRDLAGRRVVVTAGGTREPLDPVRYLGNRSSGKQGVRPRRARPPRAAPTVTLVAANIALPAPDGRRRRAGRDRARAAGGGRRRPRRTPTSSSWPRPPPTSGPPPYSERQDQEVAPTPGRRTSRADHRAGRATPTSSPGWSRARRGGAARRSSSASPPRPATRRHVWTTPGPSWPARAATCWWSTRSAPTRPSARTTTTVHLLRRGSRRTSTDGRPGVQGRGRRRGVGRRPAPCSTEH